MANYHNLLSKCDRALMAYLVAKGAGAAADVVPAKWSLDRQLPCTVCYSEKAEEAAPYSGTYVVRASVMVRSAGAVESSQGENAARLASESRMANTFDAFHTDIDSAGDKLAGDITAAARALAAADEANHGDLADFTVLDVVLKGVEASFEEGTVVWVDTINLELVCCPAAVE